MLLFCCFLRAPMDFFCHLLHYSTKATMIASYKAELAPLVGGGNNIELTKNCNDPATHNNQASQKAVICGAYVPADAPIGKYRLKVWAKFSGQDADWVELDTAKSKVRCLSLLSFLLISGVVPFV